MKVLLIIGFFIPFIYFGYLITQLDIFLSNNGLFNEPENYTSAIVLGVTDLARKTIEGLENNGIQVINVSDPFQLIKEQKLCYLFALSESDADNIAFCKIGKRLYGIKKMISICNHKKNENMFLSESITYMLREKASADKLLQNLKLNQEAIFCE